MAFFLSRFVPEDILHPSSLPDQSSWKFPMGALGLQRSQGAFHITIHSDQFGHFDHLETEQDYTPENEHGYPKRNGDWRTFLVYLDVGSCDWWCGDYSTVHLHGCQKQGLKDLIFVSRLRQSVQGRATMAKTIQCADGLEKVFFFKHGHLNMGCNNRCKRILKKMITSCIWISWRKI